MPPQAGRYFVTSPTAFSENYGDHSINLGLGVNLLLPSGPLKGHRTALEFTVPVWQELNGVQLETDHSVWAGWQFAW